MREMSTNRARDELCECMVRNGTGRDGGIALSDQVRHVSELGVGYIVGDRL